MNNRERAEIDRDITREDDRFPDDEPEEVRVRLKMWISTIAPNSMISHPTDARIEVELIAEHWDAMDQTEREKAVLDYLRPMLIFNYEEMRPTAPSVPGNQ